MPIIISNHEHYLTIATVDHTNSLSHVPARVYTIHDMGPFSPDALWKERDRFDLPAKVYGKTVDYKNLIWDDYKATEGALGIILEGVKGTGKTLLAESLANQFIAGGHPVLLIDRAWPVSTIRTMIAVMGPCMVFIDEFGKLYDDDAKRNEMLTLFSDSSLKKVLFVVTANKREELSQYMVERPGRFKYYIEYGKVEDEVVTQLFDEAKVSPDLRGLLTDYLSFHVISFDVLRFLAKEAAKCTTAKELAARMEILNIPAMVYPSYTLKRITLGEEIYYGEANYTADEHGTHTLEIFDLKGNVAVHEQFDWQTVVRRTTNVSSTSTRYSVQVNPHLTLIVERNLRSTLSHYNEVVVDLGKKPAARETESASPSDDPLVTESSSKVLIDYMGLMPSLFGYQSALSGKHTDVDG